MSTLFNPSFKNSLVEKALNRGSGVTLEDLAKEHNVAKSSIYRWIKEAQRQEHYSTMKSSSEEKRPKDWSRTERLQAVIDCGGLDEPALNSYCRKQGIYPHHISQWKADFIAAGHDVSPSQQGQLKQLKAENKALQKELQRKDKALAETAALLVLKKKAQHLFQSGEDN